MKLQVPMILFKGYRKGASAPPRFCREHHLLHRFSIRWEGTEDPSESVFRLVRKLLKLFPFEWTQVVRQEGRVQDVFDDWDSYLDWVKAGNSGKQALFQSVRILRQKQVLGFMQWEGKEPDLELAVYTQFDQTAPFLEACRSLAQDSGLTPEASWRFQEGSQSWDQELSLIRKIQECALSFFSSSVKRGTISKRSPTKP